MVEISDLDSFCRRVDSVGHLNGCIIKNVDLSSQAERLAQLEVENTFFLGCTFPPSLIGDLQARGATFFPRIPDLPFNPYRARLYTPQDLFNGFNPENPLSYCDTLDAQIYRYWTRTGRANPDDLRQALARRLHDHAMSAAVQRFIAPYEKIVAIMGGHAMLRDSADYLAVARMAHRLCGLGYLLISGGGPGAMEATHLGVWFHGRPLAELEDGVHMLTGAPSYKDREWLAAAYRVREKYPQVTEEAVSLGIPTWLYGHEPPTPFATHIAKYFDNSVREDGLVTLATHGIIFTPGSAGTIQEIFQDATQNHYGTTGLLSPMIFLGERYWTEEKPVYPLLSQLAAGEAYAEFLALFDSEAEVIAFLQAHPPTAVDHATNWSFCDVFTPPDPHTPSP